MARLSPYKVRPKLRAWAKYALQVQHEQQYTEIALAALIARRVVRRPRTKLILLVLAAVCVERVQQIDRACRGVPHPIEVRIINFLTADGSTFSLHCRFRLPNIDHLYDLHQHRVTELFFLFSLLIKIDVMQTK